LETDTTGECKSGKLRKREKERKENGKKELSEGKVHKRNKEREGGKTET
jgi:hypothetical protein